MASYRSSLDELWQQTAQAADLLASLDDDSISQLIQLLAGVDPLSAEESTLSTQLSDTKKVSRSTIEALTTLASFFVYRAPDHPDEVKRLVKETTVEDKATFEQKLDLIRNVAPRILRPAVIQQELEAIMPSFASCTIAHDLRLVENDATSEKLLAPVAIVRLILDERDDIVFQCSPPQITKLIKALSRSAEQLKILSQVAREAKIDS